MLRIDEIFTIVNGQGLSLLECDESEKGIPFVSRTSNNNGVVAFVDELEQIEPLEGHCITVALGGSVLASFYQPKPFYTAFHIQCLYPKKPLTQNEMLYYCTIIEKNKYRYNYGRQANKTLRTIKVPAPNNIPQWIQEFPLEIGVHFNHKPLVSKQVKLAPVGWKSFKYADVFEIKNGYYNRKPENTPKGEIPFIGATENQNGVTSYHALEEIDYTDKAQVGGKDAIENKLFLPNCITVSNNGSVGCAFYQPVEFTCSHDVNVLYLKAPLKMNVYIAQFLITLIEKEKYRWAYGRKWRPSRMPDSIIKLPVTKEGLPDWIFMENYIKSLPYSSSLI